MLHFYVCWMQGIFPIESPLWIHMKVIWRHVDLGLEGPVVLLKVIWMDPELMFAPATARVASGRPPPRCSQP